MSDTLKLPRKRTRRKCEEQIFELYDDDNAPGFRKDIRSDLLDLFSSLQVEKFDFFLTFRTVHPFFQSFVNNGK